MKLEKTTRAQIETFVKLSKAAFDTDITVGAPEVGDPPDYDSVDWHIKMMEQGHLFTAVENDEIVGGAIVFVNERKEKELYLGRIFIAPQYHKKGYGLALMKCVEELFSDCAVIYLDTPVWNVRTTAFYPKAGYEETKRDEEAVFYRKRLNCSCCDR